MKTKIVRIGNSHGIRIPKSLLHQCRLDGPVADHVLALLAELFAP